MVPNKEIINVVSQSPNKNRRTGGPNKVFYNALLGFELLKQPYVINKSIENYKLNWIQSSIYAFIEAAVKNIPVIAGPNLFTFPTEIPILMPPQDHIIYLHPASWPTETWRHLGYDTKNIRTWPVGIDWKKFQVKRNRYSNKALIYFKRRNPLLLEKSIEILQNKKIEPILIKYGTYTEEEYLEALAKVKFGIWIGVSESQGIGLQEALASDLPLIVLDVNSFWDEYPKVGYPFPKKLKNFQPTSAPYFDKTCGKIIYSIEQLPQAIDFVLDNLTRFSPKMFIQENLSLEKSTAKLITLFTELELIQKRQALVLNRLFQVDSIDIIKINGLMFEYWLRKKIKNLKLFFLK